MSLISKKPGILNRPLSRSKLEIGVGTFAFLFSEMILYCRSRVSTVTDLHAKLHDLGYEVGTKILDVNYIREKGYKRETDLLKMLVFIKVNIWRSLFGKEADGVEHSNDDHKTYYIIEKDPVVNSYISVPKDEKSTNCASFNAGIIEALLKGSNFNATVTAHWHKGTAYMIRFDEETIVRSGQS